jgi:hypothetical protein
MNELSKQQQAVANINTLRSALQTQIELRHRVTGAKITFDREAYENGKLEGSGYNPKDWVPAGEFEGTEPSEPVAGDESQSLDEKK